MSLFKNSYFLYTYSFIAISIGLYYHNLGKIYIKKYDVITLLFFETLCVLFCVSIYLAHKHKLSYSNIHKEIMKVTIADHMVLFGFAVYGVFASYIGLEFLKHHDITKIRLVDFIAGIPITAFGLYYFSSKPLTTEQIIGVVAVMAGGYMYLK